MNEHFDIIHLALKLKMWKKRVENVFENENIDKIINASFKDIFDESFFLQYIKRLTDEFDIKLDLEQNYNVFNLYYPVLMELYNNPDNFIKYIAEYTKVENESLDNYVKIAEKSLICLISLSLQNMVDIYSAITYNHHISEHYPIMNYLLEKSILNCKHYALYLDQTSCTEESPVMGEGSVILFIKEDSPIVVKYFIS